MSEVILKIEHVSKQYRLGLVGAKTIRDDFSRLWASLLGKENPLLKVGEVNDRSTTAKGNYVWALRDINFEVKRGEVLGVIGKNGAGKSTLLKILSRITSPTTGSIKSKGSIASLLEVGTGFHPELTGRENIFLNGAILGMSKAEITIKLDEIISFSGCERYIDTPVKRYSSGMKVRLAFAVAAHLEPEILVVDEVLAVGDAEFQKKAIGKMHDISRGEGRTVIFVSHNMSSIQRLCDRVLLLENGYVKSQGEVDVIIDEYLSSSLEQEESHIKIINEEERQGNKKISIDNVELHTQDGLLPRTGMPLVFKFHLNNPDKFKQNQLVLDFRIDDQLGQRLLWVSTSLKDFKKDEVADNISFQFDKLPLNYGNYKVTTYLTINNTVADWAKNAFSFKVTEGFYYTTKHKVDSSQSKILIDYSISYND